MWTAWYLQKTFQGYPLKNLLKLFAFTVRILLPLYLISKVYDLFKDLFPQELSQIFFHDLPQ